MEGKAGEEDEPVLAAMPATGTPAGQVMERMRGRVRTPPARAQAVRECRTRGRGPCLS
jgi:hypothetical protein